MKNILSSFYRFRRIPIPGKNYTDSRVGIWHWDIINNVFSVNSFWYEKLGYKKNRTRTLDSILSLVHQDEIEGFSRAITDFLNPSGEKIIDYELRLKRKDGSWLWIYLNGKVTVCRKKSPVRAEGIFLDITRQKKIELELQNKNNEIEALYEESEAQNEEMAAMMDELHRNQLELEASNLRVSMSEAKFRDIFENSPIGMIQSTPEGRLISANKAFCRTFGYDSEEDLANSITDTYTFYNEDNMRDSIVKLTETDKFVYSQDVTGKKKDGTPVYTNVYMMRLTDKFSGEDYLTTFVEDITNLRLSQFERDLFFNNSGDLILISAADGEIKQLNPAWEEILGWDIDDLITLNTNHLIHPDDLNKVILFRKRLTETGEKLSLTARYRNKNGEYRLIRWNSIFFKDRGLLFSSGRDETERYEAEMELQRIWDRLELALQSGAIGLWDYNIKEKILTANSNMADLIGFNRLDNADKSWKNFIHEDDYKTSLKTLSEVITGKREIYITEHRLKLIDGNYRWFFSRGKVVERDSGGKPIRISGSITDITEQKEAEHRRLALEYQMLQSQKLESLGLLAGGIAHDFNNLLTGILGNADMLLYELPEHFPVQQKLLDIRKAAKRASELTKQMLAYTGKSTFSAEVIDLNNLIFEMSSLFDISVSKKVKIVYSLAEELPYIEGDATQISQILMNLILNSSEAIDNNGEINIITSVKECDENEINTFTINREITAGNYVTVEISDNGCGIPPDKLKQIFDPFFTTKFTGRGLGLAAVSGIIRSHNAGLYVESIINKGTTFRIYFRPTELRQPEQPVKETVNLDTGKKNLRVLVADDESYIRSLTSRMLKTAGFEVLLAENGIEAVNLFIENRTSIKCIILDLTMPEMDGHEALLELRKIDDKIPIIISSGYSEFDVNSQFKGENISGFLQKPYQFEDLLLIMDSIIKSSTK